MFIDLCQNLNCWYCISNFIKIPKMCFLIILFALSTVVVDASSSANSCVAGDVLETKYLLYEVNPGEGFNLRRDVYLRIANVARKLANKEPWTLVLPPWGRLYHWKHTSYDTFYPWKTYFDVKSLRKWTKVIEFEDYLKEIGSTVDSVFLLQHFIEGWGDVWEEKYDFRKCNDPHRYMKIKDHWETTLWGNKMTVKNFSCISFQGQGSKSISLIKKYDNIRSVMLDRAETLLHDNFGDSSYWAARRSMRFSNDLIEEADNFISQYFEMSKNDVGLNIADDWRDFKPKREAGKGYPFVSVHLRRRDFVRSRPKQVPTIASAAKQLDRLLKSEKLRHLFLATDAPLKEIDELRNLLSNYEVMVYEPSQMFMDKFGDGGIAIVDQIICSYARLFTGTYESTFSFRIQEEREILGLEVQKTFNRLCGVEDNCEQPTKWLITY